MYLKNTNSKGFSIVEVLIASAISIITALAMLAMIQTQHKEVKAITEKLEIKELESFTQKVLINNTYCNCLFSGNTFNTTTNSWNSFPALLPTSYSNIPIPCSASGTSFAQVGSPIGISTATISAINMSNITELIVGSGQYTGDLNIQLLQSSLVRTVHDIKFPFSFFVDLASGAIASRNFLSCNSAAAGPFNQILLPAAPVTISAAPSYTYTYAGTKNPVQLVGVAYAFGGGNCHGSMSARWKDTLGNVIKNWTLVFGSNITSGPDGGSGMTNAGTITIPFITGATTIELGRIAGCWNTTFVPISVLEM